MITKKTYTCVVMFSYRPASNRKNRETLMNTGPAGPPLEKRSLHPIAEWLSFMGNMFTEIGSRYRLLQVLTLKRLKIYMILDSAIGIVPPKR